ncbi:type IV pilin [Halorarius litoreus]|uniref:type IV pilin n=1 Tax=Halorarius litoreus TaxID=2962676 RepID=UPI0020CB7D5B|nr:type IV pilin N-terminal domain-containing protein [Halorarius litoreus]
MKLQSLFADEDAVSPVIGVILMVAITVILAAVIGTFVLGLGENVQDSAPQANFQFEYGADYSGTGNTFDITHTGGEDVDASTVTVQIGTGSAVSGNNGGWADTISTGDTISIGDGSGGDIAATDFSSDDDVRVIWTSPSGGSSQTIGTSTVA